jgi:hypothetical protein
VILRPRVRRAVASLLASGLASAGLVLAAVSPASADIQNVVDPQIESVYSTVRPTTPMWVVDLLITLNGRPAACDTPLGAELHYLAAGHNTTSGLLTKVDACRPYTGSLGDTGKYRLMVGLDLLSRGMGAVPPSTNVGGNNPQLTYMDLWARVFPGGLDLDSERLLTGPGSEAPAGIFELPTAPVWIAVGDGYSSRLYQEPDGCTSASCYQPDLAATSWVHSSIEQINFNRVLGATNVDANWTLKPKLLARNGSTSDQLLSGTQKSDMAAALQERVLPRSGNPLGPLSSWNWVSITSGLEDVGIPALMQNYTTVLQPYQTVGSVAPWAVGNAGQCPDLDGVSTNTTDGVTDKIASKGASIKANLLALVQAATAKDQSVHTLQMLYPHLNEAGNPCAGDNVPGSTTLIGSRTAMKTLDDAINISSGDPKAQILGLDLRALFDPYPTGDPAGGRAGSPLYLTRPYGYPFPSSQGLSSIAEAIAQKVGNAADDILPPSVTGRVKENPDSADSMWFKGPVNIVWQAEDASGLAIRPNEPWDLTTETPTTTESSEGLVVYHSPYEAYDLAGNHAIGSLPVHIDHTAPLADLFFRDPDNGDFDNPWYNAPVTVTWRGFDENGELQVSGVDPSTLPTPLTLGTEGSGVLFAPSRPDMCDYATNCAEAPSATLAIDRTAPVVTSRFFTTTGQALTPYNGWLNGSHPANVVAKFDVLEELSGVNPNAADTILGDLPITLVDGTIDLGGRGARDIATNYGRATTSIRVDRTKPTFNLIIGGVPIVPGSTITAPASSAFTCPVVDTGSGPASDTCDWGLKAGSTNVYEAWAYDDAGNKQSFTWTVSSGTLATPPVVIGTPSKLMPDTGIGGWYNTSTPELHVNWSAGPLPATYDWPTTSESKLANGTSVTSLTDGIWTVGNLKDCVKNTTICTPESATTLTLKVDRTAPSINSPGIADGAVFAKGKGPAKPTTCTASDAVSGVNSIGCKVLSVTESALTTDPFGLPGTKYTATLRATDNAGNTATKAITWTVLSYTPSTSGRTTGGASLKGTSAQGTVSADFTLRCNGSPNKMNVSWNGGSFDMSSVSSILCYDDPRYDHAQPVAPHDVMAVTGKGLLCRNGSFVGHESYDEDEHWGDAGEDDSRSSWSRFDSRKSTSKKKSSSSKSSGSTSKYYTYAAATSTSSSKSHDSDGNSCGNNSTHSQSLDCVEATISFVLIDNGESGSGRDRMKIVITEVGKTTPALEISGTIVTGNVQAHEAQGNGTNNNGNVNGPTGNTSNKK